MRDTCKDSSTPESPSRRHLLEGGLYAAAATVLGAGLSTATVGRAAAALPAPHTEGPMSPDALQALSLLLPGAVFAQGSKAYDSSRSTWNGTIEQSPAAVVQARSRQDIIAAVTFASEHNLGIAIKATGHGALKAAGNDAILIDTSRMKGLVVDAERRTATFEPGVVAIEFLRAAQAHGLAAPTAVSPFVGMTGYTLSGGYGDLPRVFGLGSDNLISAEVVLADGSTRRVSETDSPDLFWAMRGGGGNFAVVTSMTVRLHPVKQVLSGVLTYDIEDARRLVSSLRRWDDTIPDNMTMALSFFATSVTGTPRPVVTLALVYFGDPEQGQPLVDALVADVKPISNTVKAQSYLSYFENDVKDPGYGFRNYWHGVLIDELTDPVVDILRSTVEQPDSMMMLLFSYYRGGAWSRLDEGTTAVSHRNASWLLNGRAFFKGDAATVARAQTQVSGLARQLAPYSSGVPFTYVEYEGPSRLPDVYGEAKLARLREIKRRYDPSNLLRFNANIAPA